MRAINEIIIHCTATPAGRPVSVDDIRAWHLARGFRDIGYHYIIYLDGSVHTGRPVTQAGAHCKGHNAHSIGVCYVGGVDATGRACDTRTTAQKKSLLRLIAHLRQQFRAATVHGHNEFAAKACPCFNVRAEFHEP